jgi:hypothetical protein
MYFFVSEFLNQFAVGFPNFCAIGVICKYKSFPSEKRTSTSLNFFDKISKIILTIKFRRDDLAVVSS